MTKKINPIIGFLPTAPIIIYIAYAILQTIIHPTPPYEPGAYFSMFVLLFDIPILLICCIPGLLFTISIKKLNHNEDSHGLLITSHCFHVLAMLISLYYAYLGFDALSIRLRNNSEITQSILDICISLIACLFLTASYIIINKKILSATKLQKGES